MKAAYALSLLPIIQAQQTDQSSLRSLAEDPYITCNTTDLSQWESTLDTCNLNNQHLSFRACTKINTGQRQDQYKSSAHSYAYYVKQFLTFKTCYHGSNWKKLYFWQAYSDEVCQVETEHTMSVPDYFYATQNCVNNYCTECYNQCGGGNDDGGDGDRMLNSEDNSRDEDDAMNNGNGQQGYDYDWSTISMNCNSCETGCSSYATLSGIYGGNYDNYYPPYCTQVYDQSGTDYYYGPKCTENGGVAMGFFFDNKCELNVKKDISIDESSSTISSTFDVFAFVHGICHDCATGVCESVYDAAYHCTADNGTYVAEGSSIINEYEGGYYNNKDNGEDEVEAVEELCLKTHKLKDIVYYHNHSSRVKAEKKAWEIAGFVALGVVCCAVAAFGFVSYTYYVRHCVDWGDSNLMCWTECGGCGGDIGDVGDDEDDVVVTKKNKKGRRLV